MKSKDYNVVTWADGFGNWHATALFFTPLGNTGAAERVALNALKTCKRAIRREIVQRMEPTQTKRLAYRVSANSFEPGSGRLETITISEM